MIEVVAEDVDSEGSGCRFVIRPNCSLSWQQTVQIFGGIAVVALTIGAFLTLMGAWLVLPFAGLEVIALGAGLYVCARRGAEREVISILPDRIAIERGRYRPQFRCELLRAWATVHLLRASRRGYPSRLTIRSHGREVEVGACLVEEEREELAQALRRTLAA